MKKLFLFCFVFLILSSCSDIKKYDVYTDSTTYEQFTTDFQTTIEDGKYIRLEMSNSEWESIVKNDKSNLKDYHHRWDLEELRLWFVTNGFGAQEASKESMWLTLVNHGMIIWRDYNMVYITMK